MSKDIDIEKDNSKLKGNKSFLESCIMHLNRCLLVWVIEYNFLILVVLKDFNLKNILRFFLDFHLELSR